MTSSSIPQTRLCKRCDTEYPLTNEYFHKDKKAKHGLAYRCKLCAIKNADEWRRADPERAKNTHHDTYMKHKDKHAQQGREWATANPDKVYEIKQRWADTNRDRKRSIGREWAKSHPEQRINWRASNPEKYRANNKSHKAKRRSQMRQAEGHFTRADILRLYSEQEGRCAYCAISIFWDIPRDIHVDHIIPLSRGGSNWPDNLALTCQECNLGKADKLFEEWLPVRGW